MLVLTGMNFKNQDTLYDHAKKSLKTSQGGVADGCSSPGPSIKIEPAFLAENEEALLAAGYAK